MAIPSTPLPISPYAQSQVMRYAQNIFTYAQQDTTFRNRLMDTDRLYYRETDLTQEQRRAKASNDVGDANKMQNVTIPIVQPQVDNATAFFVELFLSQYPIFPVIAAPQDADAALQLTTSLGQQGSHFNWAQNLGMCFGDMFRHNICALEVDWVKETVPSIVTDERAGDARAKKMETVFEGNKLKRIDLYNLLMDMRVHPSEVHKRGEYVGYTELMTRIELVQMMLDLDPSLTMNSKEAFESPTAVPNIGTDLGNCHYYIPHINPAITAQQTAAGFNWMRWLGDTKDTRQRIMYQGMYEVTTLYCRIIPREFGIHPRGSDKNPGDPHIYKFIIVNQRTVVYCKRMTNAHNWLPIIIGQLNNDGLGLQTKSYAQNAAPFQQLSSALYNSGIASQRRKVYDRLFYDPSRINKKDIDNPDPVARIPVKQSAYGKPLQDAVWANQYNDNGVADILGMAREVIGMADDASGSNRVQRGQFQRGNKTLGEFNQVMSNSDARPRASAMLLSHSWFQPIKHIVKLNTLQFQPSMKVFNAQEQREVNINPVDLRKLAWEFQMMDGSSPRENYLDDRLFGQVLQYASAVPQIGAEWDLSGMFAYQLKMRGARWVDNFRRTAAQQQQFMNNQVALQAAGRAAPAGPSGVPTGIPGAQ